MQFLIIWKWSVWKMERGLGNRNLIIQKELGEVVLSWYWIKMSNQIEGIEYSIESIEGGWKRTPGWRFCSTSSQPPALAPTIRSCSTTLHEPQVLRNAALFWQCLKCLKKMCNVQKQPGKTKKTSLISLGNRIWQLLPGSWSQTYMMVIILVQISNSISLY